MSSVGIFPSTSMGEPGTSMNELAIWAATSSRVKIAIHVAFSSAELVASTSLSDVG
eukprot:CAMPEP_0119324642 /NCGR_PEP_ID=MMETSP1333-20130426/63804_1 /TAXON_ID=418940 /ORGANISM="Scyphosphaera apsteinii, Strain RCC1455" /LENGTH=55 /DNA_ID=CAMNT_0007332409 /DNA_START=266 /DNA_END=433 /DNA_ORIENTATION=-